MFFRVTAPKCLELDHLFVVSGDVMKKRINITVSPEIMEELEASAAASGMDRAQHVQAVLAAAVEEYEQENSEPVNVVPFKR